MRLDAVLGEVLGIRKKAAAQLVYAGEVSVAGTVRREPHYQVVLGEEADVELRGSSLINGSPDRRQPTAHRLYLVHKPRQCQCVRLNTDDERFSVYDLCQQKGIAHANLGCFGRLDANTTGLLLMGTDGGLQSLLMHPSSGCEKDYVATLKVHPRESGDQTAVRGRLRATAAEEFARGGLRLADGHECAPATLEVLETVNVGDGVPFPRRVRLTLHEGQNHQVKKMLGACGASVDALCRERIGGLSLAGMPGLAEEGAIVEAGEREVQLLRAMLPLERTESAETSEESAEGAAEDVAAPPAAPAAAPPAASAAVAAAAPPPADVAEAEATRLLGLAAWTRHLSHRHPFVDSPCTSKAEYDAWLASMAASAMAEVSRGAPTLALPTGSAAAAVPTATPGLAPAATTAAVDADAPPITLDASTGDAVVLERLGCVVVNSDGTLSRITNWDSMTDGEKETARRLLSKRNRRRLEGFREAGTLTPDLMSALRLVGAADDGVQATPAAIPAPDRGEAEAQAKAEAAARDHSATAEPEAQAKATPDAMDMATPPPAPAPVPPGFVPLPGVRAPAPGRAVAAPLPSGRRVAVFAHRGRLFAVDAECPHQGAALETGDIEDAGASGPCVTCPRHGWRFELESGFCEDLGDYGVRAYEARALADGRLCVSEVAKPQPERSY